MTILNISIFTFLIGLGLFSYTIYERSSILSSEEQKPKTENLNYKNDKKVLETSQNEKSLLDIRNSLQSEILTKKLEIKEQKYPPGVRFVFLLMLSAFTALLFIGPRQLA